MKKVFILSLLLIRLPAFHMPRALDDSAIDNLVDRTMKAFEVPGNSVGVIKDGKVIHSKGYGVRSLNTMQKMDENTLVAIGSNTKAFIRPRPWEYSLTRERSSGMDKVRDYIPEFKLYNPM
jgi:CubicO group peptidase (beta-lactamase class C family)